MWELFAAAGVYFGAKLAHNVAVIIAENGKQKKQSDPRIGTIREARIKTFPVDPEKRKLRKY